MGKLNVSLPGLIIILVEDRLLTYRSAIVASLYETL